MILTLIFTYLSILIVCCAAYYIYLYHDDATDGEDIKSIFENVPCTVNTCEKFMPEAIACAERARKVGFKNVVFVDGDNDARIDNDQVFFKNRSFLATCMTMVENETPFMLMLEEDTTFDESRLHLLSETIKWALTHTDEWDLLYGGCILKNPAVPILGSIHLLRSRGGQLGGHCLLVPLHMAKQYVTSTENRKTSFDKWFSRQKDYRSIMVTPAVASQKNRPYSTPTWLPGTHKFHQDFTLIAWPIVIGLSTTLPLLFILLLIIRIFKR